jgi:hypothetical protein
MSHPYEHEHGERYEHIAEMLVQIQMKHCGRTPLMTFIIIVTPQLAELDATAVDDVLEDLLNGSRPEWWKDEASGYGRIYQCVRELMVVRGFPDPEDKPGALRTRQIHPLPAGNGRPN